MKCLFNYTGQKSLNKTLASAPKSSPPPHRTPESNTECDNTMLILTISQLRVLT